MVLIDMAGSSAIPGPLHHAHYNGFTYADTIFPLFLLLVGISMTLTDRGGRFLPALSRTAKLCVISSVLIAFKYDHWFNLDTGVLQQIAVAFMFTWAIMRLPLRYQRIVICSLLAFVVAAYLWIPAASVQPGHFISGHTIADAFDRWTHSDGLHAYLPSIASVYAGVEVGRLLGRHRGRALTIRLASFGVALTAAGLVLALVIPLNKHLWTPSYVLVGAGLATLAYLAWQGVIGVTGPRWFAPFALLGRNAIAVYIFDELAMRELRNSIWPLIQGSLTTAIGATATSLAFPLFALAMCLGLCALMERRHLRLRL
jgi:predicted acyltransferase